MLALTLAVLVLRASQLRQSLYGDEIWTYGDIVGHGLGRMIHDVYTGPENSPPLFFVLSWLSSKLGHPLVSIRLPSLLLGAGTIPLLYLVGREALDRRAGLLAAAILGLSPFSLYYGIEARSYATMAFCIVLSTFALLRAVRSGRRRWWLVYAAAAAAAAYSHYTAVFALAVQGLWSLWACRDRVREPLLANALVVLLYLPWLGHIRGKSLDVIGALRPLTAGNVTSDLLSVVPGYPYAGLHLVPTTVGLIAILAPAVAGLVWWLRALAAQSGRVLDKGRQALLSPGGLVMTMAIATPVGLLVYSILKTDLWLSRGLYASVPYICLALAACCLALPRPARAASVVVLLAVLIFATARTISPDYVRTPWRDVARYLDRVAGPRDPVISYGIFAGPGTAIEFGRPHPVYPAAASEWQLGGPGTTTWLMLDDRFDAAVHLPTPHPAGFQLVARRHYRGLLPITVLGFRRR